MKKTLYLLASALCGALLLAGPLHAGMLVAAVPVASFLGIDDSQPFRRTRRNLPAFQNVVASGIAICEIPRYSKTLFGAGLRLGGTTFLPSQITDVRLRLGGSKTLWVAAGSDLRTMNAYKAYYDGNAQFLWVDFAQVKSKSLGGEYVGGIDMSVLPDGKLTLEVTTSGATAPTLVAKGYWGPAGTGAVMQKLLKVNFSTAGTGRMVLPITKDTLRGARLRRLFALYGGTDWLANATSTAWASNVGTSTFGTITSPAGTKVGTWKVELLSATKFTLTDPNGITVSSVGTLGVAYAPTAAPNFTLTSGGAPAIGDGYDIVVAENTDGNVSRMEVIKNGEAVWDFQCTEARQLQKQHGFIPQSKMTVVDFEVDNWPDGSLKTSDADTLEIAATLTAADTLTLYAEVLDSPSNNIN